jgi:ABC-type uncharacterized transport system permease subunit
MSLTVMPLVFLSVTLSMAVPSDSLPKSARAAVTPAAAVAALSVFAGLLQALKESMAPTLRALRLATSIILFVTDIYDILSETVMTPLVAPVVHPAQPSS